MFIDIVLVVDVSVIGCNGLDNYSLEAKMTNIHKSITTLYVNHDPKLVK